MGGLYAYSLHLVEGHVVSVLRIKGEMTRPLKVDWENHVVKRTGWGVFVHDSLNRVNARPFFVIGVIGGHLTNFHDLYVLTQHGPSVDRDEHVNVGPVSRNLFQSVISDVNFTFCTNTITFMYV